MRTQQAKKTSPGRIDHAEDTRELEPNVWTCGLERCAGRPGSIKSAALRCRRLTPPTTDLPGLLTHRSSYPARLDHISPRTAARTEACRPQRPTGGVARVRGTRELAPWIGIGSAHGIGRRAGSSSYLPHGRSARRQRAAIAAAGDHGSRLRRSGAALRLGLAGRRDLLGLRDQELADLAAENRADDVEVIELQRDA